jgi:hypothetical protein
VPHRTGTGGWVRTARAPGLDDEPVKCPRQEGNTSRDARPVRLSLTATDARRTRAAGFGAALIALVLTACTGESSAPLGPEGTVVQLELTGVRPLDPATEGRWVVWILDANGQAHRAGDVQIVSGRAEVRTPITDGRAIELRVEPPAGRTGASQTLLRGQFRNGRADLVVAGALTQAGLGLRDRPGQFTMFTPSDNAVNDYPSHEESGVWLFNMAPRETPQNDMWVRLTPLQSGWVYEGWMVRDYGTAAAIWLSYGKFTPDPSGAINRRDDTGWGPFSGVLNYQTAGEEEFPGDDWIANPLGLPFPSQLTLPLDLRERASDGSFRWTHVITIEPASDRGEPITTERPFLLQLYRDPFGAGGPGVARTLTFFGDEVPAGFAHAGSS